MIIKIYYHDQLIGEKPVRDYKAACYYLLEQEVEFQLFEENFTELESLMEWELFFDDQAVLAAQNARRLLESGKTVVLVGRPNDANDQVHLYELEPRQNPAENDSAKTWKEIFDDFCSRLSDKEMRVDVV